MKRSHAGVSLILTAFSASAFAGDSVLHYSQSALPLRSEKLHVEQVHIHRTGDMPNLLHRKDSRSRVLVIDKNHDNSDASIVVEQALSGKTWQGLVSWSLAKKYIYPHGQVAEVENAIP